MHHFSNIGNQQWSGKGFIFSGKASFQPKCNDGTGFLSKGQIPLSFTECLDNFILGFIQPVERVCSFTPSVVVQHRAIKMLRTSGD